MYNTVCTHLGSTCHRGLAEVMAHKAGEISSSLSLASTDQCLQSLCIGLHVPDKPQPEAGTVNARCRSQTYSCFMEHLNLPAH